MRELGFSRNYIFDTFHFYNCLNCKSEVMVLQKIDVVALFSVSNYRLLIPMYLRYDNVTKNRGYEMSER